MGEVLNRKVAPSFVKPKFFKVPQVQRVEEDVPFWVYQEDQVPLFKLELVFAVNKSMEKTPGVGLISSKMLTEGTSGFSSKQIQDLSLIHI